MSSETTIRRHFRKPTLPEDVKLRRSRGEIACAECRRLKLKCDRKLPCTSCVRRGCSNVCPNGSVVPVYASREAPSGSGNADKFARLEKRVKDLEEALLESHQRVSEQPHPLLEKDLVKLQAKGAEDGIDDKTVFKTIDALGTLTIDDKGSAKYFGTSAGCEALFFVNVDGDVPDDENDDLATSIFLQADIQRLSQAFPLGITGDMDSDATLQFLYSVLPPQARAWALCESFLQQGSWSFTPILRDELINDILTPAYKLAKAEGGYAKTDIVSPHKLAVLFIIFCMGTLMDRTLPPNDQAAAVFLHCGKAALSLGPIFDSPEMATVQALALLAYYHYMSSKDYSIGEAWSLIDLAQRLGQGMGLHRDPAQWGLDMKTVQRRRFVFWSLYSSGLIWSFALGRPPAIQGTFIDCKLPEVDLYAQNESPEMEVVRSWKWNFAREIIGFAIEDCLSAKAPNYKVVLEWDRKIRDREVPSHLTTFPVETDFQRPLNDYIRGTMCLWLKTTTLLYIHRPFFVQAILDYPNDPFTSIYAPSFTAAYNCASILIKLMSEKIACSPYMLVRWSNTWTHLFSSAAIVSMLVSRYPGCAMARNAYAELSKALEIFERHATEVPRAKSCLRLLNRLREKADASYARHSSGKLVPGDDQPELAIFGGQTRVLVSDRLKQQPKPKRQREDSRQTTPPSASSGSSSIPASDSIDSPLQPTEFDAILQRSLMTPDSEKLAMEWMSIRSQFQASNLAPNDARFQSLNDIVGIEYGHPHPYANTGSQPQPEPAPAMPTNTGNDYNQMLLPPGVESSDMELTEVMSNLLERSAQQGMTAMDWGLDVANEAPMDTEEWLELMRQSGILLHR